MDAPEVDHPLESLDALVERRSAVSWLVIGVGSAVALLAGTTVAVGVADLLLVGGAVLTGLAGISAAGRRRQLASLPLELAEELAVRQSLRGAEATVRGWLGRGRRLEDLHVRAEVDGEPVSAIVPRGPVVGRFQVVVPVPTTGVLRVDVRARAADGEQSVARVYAIEAARPGRFAPGVAVDAGGLRHRPGEWSVIQAETEGVGR
jgi:hypothetical protein